MKNFSNTYLYNKYNKYEQELFNFVMNGTVIEKNTEAFEDIKFQVKKCPISNNLIKVLMSNNVVLMTGNRPLPKAFKVTAMKDIRGDHKIKVFIDCTGLIHGDAGSTYECGNINILISYLVSAVTTMIYTVKPNAIFGDTSLVMLMTETYSTLFTYIIDYLYKISGSSTNIKNKCQYLCSMYFLTCLLEKDPDKDATSAIARKVSGISEREEDLIKIKIHENSYLNIKEFADTLSKILLLDKLTCDVIVEKWMWLYGTGTVFALELFPPFASMITDAYVGAYINNQKTIEKVADRKMVEMSKKLINIGAGLV